MMLGAKRAVLAPPATAHIYQLSGWTNTLLRGHASPSVQGVMMPGARRAVLGPYGGGLLPPQINDYANKADGLKPIRTVGVMMLGAKGAAVVP